MKKQITKQKTRFKMTFKFFLVLLMLGSFKTFSQISQTGAALKFDGASDFVNLGSAITTSLNGGNSITIEAWVNTATKYWKPRPHCRQL